MRFFLKIFLVLIVAVGGFGYWKAQQFKSQFAGRQAALDVMAATPADIGLDYSTFAAVTSDDVMISGWWIPREGAVATVLVVHGFGLNKSHMLSRAEIMHEVGFNVAMIDLRARGESGGRLAEVGPKAALDVHAAMSALAEIDNLGDGLTVGYGFSHGARTVIFAAAQAHGFDAVIAESPPFSLREGLMRTMNIPWAPPMGEGDIGMAIEEIGDVPFFLWAGDSDEGLTIEQINQLVERAQHSASSVHIFEGAGHGVFLPNTVAEYRTQLQQLLQSKTTN